MDKDITTLTESPKIDFKINPVYACYTMWRDTLNGSGSPEFTQKAQKFAEAFQSEEISALTNSVQPWGHPQTLGNIQNVQGLIGKEDIRTVEGLREILNANFHPDDARQLTEAIAQALPAYQRFLDNNQEKISADMTALEQSQQTYAADFANLYACLGVLPEKQGTMYINPSPTKPILDGISNADSANMNYSLIQTEPAGNYYEGSNIPSRKISTPFHEMTHFLFYNSRVKEELSNSATGGAKNLMNYLTTQFENNPGEMSVGKDPKKNALAAMNEAIAVCSTALYNEKTTGAPVKEGDKWYHGFEMANRVAPIIYPHFKEYVKGGRPFDDRFYEAVLQGLKNRERAETALAKLHSEKPKEEKPAVQNADDLIMIKSGRSVEQTKAPAKCKKSNLTAEQTALIAAKDRVQG